MVALRIDRSQANPSPALDAAAAEPPRQVHFARLVEAPPAVGAPARHGPHAVAAREVLTQTRMLLRGAGPDAALEPERADVPPSSRLMARDGISLLTRFTARLDPPAIPKADAILSAPQRELLRDLDRLCQAVARGDNCHGLDPGQQRASGEHTGLRSVAAHPAAQLQQQLVFNHEVNMRYLQIQEQAGRGTFRLLSNILRTRFESIRRCMQEWR